MSASRQRPEQNKGSTPSPSENPQQTQSTPHAPGQSDPVVSSSLRPLSARPPYAPLSIQPAASTQPMPYYPIPIYPQMPMAFPPRPPPATESTGQETKRTRISRACDSCRRKKVRCETRSAGEKCKNCQAANIECTFNDRSAKKRGPPKGYIEVLENRLKRMEKILSGLADEKPEHAKDSIDQDKGSTTKQHESPNTTTTGAETERNTVAMQADDESRALDGTCLITDSTARYVGDMSPLPFLAQKINFEDAKVASRIGFRVRKFGQSLVVYKEQDQEEEKYPNQHLLRSLGILKPGETINTINDWIYKVSGLDRATSDKLMKVYFAYIHPGLPVINKVLFLKQYRRELGDYPSAPLLNAIYGAAVRYIETCKLFGDKVFPTETEQWDFGDGYSENLFERLLCYIKGKYAPSVSTIQALVIAQSHRASLDAKLASSWLLSSAATRTAQDLGLHRSSADWDIPESEKETRRRVWWAVYIMDRWTSAATGRPQTIFDEDCDESYPSEFGTWEEVMDLPPSSSVADDDLLRFPSLDMNAAQKAKGEKIPLYQPFLQLVKLSEILGRILQGLYTPTAKRLSARHGSDAIVSYLDKSLSEWRANLPPSLQISSANARRLDSRGQTPLLSMSGLIYLSYCTLLILLHRPFIENNKDDGPRTRLSFSSLTICTNAATRCVDVAEKMHYRDFLVVSWRFAIYPIFTAALIHIYNAASEDNIVADVAKANLTKAMTVIQRLSRLSEGAAKLYAVIKQLMDTRNISVHHAEDSDTEMKERKSKRKKKQQSANQSSEGFMSGKTSDVGRGSLVPKSVSPQPLPQPVISTVPSVEPGTERKSCSSGGSTPSSILNGDWINGLYPCIEQEQRLAQPTSSAPPVAPVDAQQSLTQEDMHSLRQFGLYTEPMFPTVEELQVLATNQQQDNNNQGGSLMMPLYSAESMLFGIPDLGFAMSGIFQEQQVQALQQHQQQQQQALPVQNEATQFRNRPDNPFWGMPSSIELDDWTAYLLPQQHNAHSTTSANDTSSTLPQQPWNASHGWM